MKTVLLLVLILFILILLIKCVNVQYDGFVDSHGSFVSDRLKQYGNIGNSLITADTTGVLGNSANNKVLNSPSDTSHPLNTSPTGLFATIKTCEAIKTMDCNAFDNAEFALNCGVCLDGLNAKNSAGDIVPGGGLVLLADDKLHASDKNKSNFMPIYTATVGFCPAGKLVSTKAECLKLQAQLLCQKNKSFDLPGCSQCYTSGEYSVVDQNTVTGHGTISLVGSGLLTINQSGVSSVSNIKLSSTPYVFDVNVHEGGTIKFTVFPESLLSSVYIAGCLSGPTFNGEFTTDIRKLVLVDEVSGRKPRSSGTVTVNETPVTKMAPIFGQALQPNQPKMSIVITIPFSFVDTTTEEASLCKDGPYSTKVSTATDDPCYAKGSGPGNYSLECLQNIWLSNGCNQSGNAYPKDGSSASRLMSNLDGTFRSSNTIADFIYNKALITATGMDANGNKQPIRHWSDASEFCIGVTIASPCEGSTKDTGPLSPDCLIHLWKNKGANDSLGATYSGYGTSLSDSTPQYCQQTGTLSPSDINGNINDNVVAWWQAKGGVNAVKKIMSDIYAAANAPNSTDNQRLPYITQCYGPIRLAQRPPPPPPVVYTCPSDSMTLLDSPVTIAKGALIANNVRFTSNFTLTAYVTPKGGVDGWASLLHFTTGDDSGPFGARALAIWFYPGSTSVLAVHIDHSTQPGWAARVNDQAGLPVPFTVGKTSKLEIICNVQVTRILVDGQAVGSFIHDGQRYSGNVKVYASNPWYSSANCTLEKLCLKALP